MKRKHILFYSALALTAALIIFRPAMPESRLPGDDGSERKLVRIWTVSSIGGGQSWLKEALRGFERAHPGVMTYLRTVDADELTREEAVLPDLVLFMPGDISDPSLLSPLSGALEAEEALLRCGRWRGDQLGLPLCWGGYGLALSAALDPSSAQTPAPTTLLGRPAQTPAAATPAPGFPVEAAAAFSQPLQCPGGAALFSLPLIPGADRVNRPKAFGTLSQAEVYRRFLSGECASAMLTSGQLTALEEQAALGNAGAYRIIIPDTVITDQVWLGGLMRGACPQSAELLAYLVSAPAQRRLERQGLHPVTFSLRLYIQGEALLLDRAASRSLTCLNAFIPRSLVQETAQRFSDGQCSLDEALLPLI